MLKGNLNATVFSSKLDNKKPSILLLNESHGWLKSAEWIVVGASKYEPNGGVYHALPALFALHHGIELFLKGVTHELTGKFDNKIHDLAELLKDYNTSIRHARRPELLTNSNIQRFIDWDHSCRGHRRPHGSDFRFILDQDNKPYWPGVSLRYQDLVDWSREYRRDFARVRRLLLNVKGCGAFWEEGTFASLYPDEPLWFFCWRTKGSSHHSYRPWHNRLTDTKGRNWVTFEGEAIDGENYFLGERVGKLPEPNLRLKCSLRDLRSRLAEVQ